MATKKSPVAEPSIEQAQDLIQLAAQFKLAVEAFQKSKIDFEEKYNALQERELVLAKRSNEIEKQAEEIKKREVELKPRELELSEKVARIATVEEANKMKVDAETKDAKAQQIMRDAQTKLKEVQIREEQLHADQLTLSQDRENYKKQVREEILANFLK